MDRAVAEAAQKTNPTAAHFMPSGRPKTKNGFAQLLTLGCGNPIK